MTTLSSPLSTPLLVCLLVVAEIIQLWVGGMLLSRGVTFTLSHLIHLLGML